MANANRPALVAEDYNGLLYAPGGSGQAEEQNEDVVLLLPRAADQPAGLTFPVSTCVNAAVVQQYLADVYAINYHHLHRHYPELRATPIRCKIIAYLRMLLVRVGLANPEIQPNTKNVMYNLCRRAENQLDELYFTNYDAKRAEWIAANANRVPTLTDIFGSATAPAYDVNVGLDAHVAQHLRVNFTDLLCLCAYFFRIRGHHYQDSFSARISAVYKGMKSSKEEDFVHPQATWEDVLRRAFKVVFPSDLDDYWLQAVAEGRCSGNISKRIHSPAAGSAALFAIYRGCEDLCTAFPALKTRFEEVIQTLVDEVNYLSEIAHRWEGSINHNFYGVRKRNFDESSLGPLAAVIKAALGEFCQDAPLLESQSLKRAANNAPITGNVMASILVSLSKSELMILQYAPKP